LEVFTVLKVKSLSLLLCLAFVVCLGTPGFAAEIEVSGGGSALQDAIDVAIEGDTISVIDSLNYNAVQVTAASLTIQAAGGENPRVSATGDGGAVVFADLGRNSTWDGIDIVRNLPGGSPGHNILFISSGPDDGTLATVRNCSVGIDVGGGNVDARVCSANDSTTFENVCFYRNDENGNPLTTIADTGGSTSFTSCTWAPKINGDQVVVVHNNDIDGGPITFNNCGFNNDGRQGWCLRNLDQPNHEIVINNCYVDGGSGIYAGSFSTLGSTITVNNSVLNGPANEGIFFSGDGGGMEFFFNNTVFIADAGQGTVMQDGRNNVSNELTFTHCTFTESGPNAGRVVLDASGNGGSIYTFDNCLVTHTMTVVDENLLGNGTVIAGANFYASGANSGVDAVFNSSAPAVEGLVTLKPGDSVHIEGGSDAADAAPAGLAATDIDGQTRDATPDFGADEADPGDSLISAPADCTPPSQEVTGGGNELQLAVDGANPGDVLVVGDANSYSALTITKTITIRAASGLGGNPLVDSISVTADGSGSFLAKLDVPGALDAAAAVTLLDCTVGGAATFNGSVNAADCTFQSTCDVAGNAGNSSLSKCTFDGDASVLQLADSVNILSSALTSLAVSGSSGALGLSQCTVSGSLNSSADNAIITISRSRLGPPTGGSSLVSMSGTGNTIDCLNSIFFANATDTNVIEAGSNNWNFTHDTFTETSQLDGRVWVNASGGTADFRNNLFFAPSSASNSALQGITASAGSNFWDFGSVGGGDGLRGQGDDQDGDGTAILQADGLFDLSQDAVASGAAENPSIEVPGGEENPLLADLDILGNPRPIGEFPDYGANELTVGPLIQVSGGGDALQVAIDAAGPFSRIEIVDNEDYIGRPISVEKQLNIFSTLSPRPVVTAVFGDCLHVFGDGVRGTWDGIDLTVDDPGPSEELHNQVNINASEDDGVVYTMKNCRIAIDFPPGSEPLFRYDSRQVITQDTVHFENVQFTRLNEGDNPHPNPICWLVDFAGGCTFRNCVFGPENTDRALMHGFNPLNPRTGEMGPTIVENCTFFNTKGWGFQAVDYPNHEIEIRGCNFINAGARLGSDQRNARISVSMENCQFEGGASFNPGEGTSKDILSAATTLGEYSIVNCGFISKSTRLPMADENNVGSGGTNDWSFIHCTFVDVFQGDAEFRRVWMNMENVNEGTVDLRNCMIVGPNTTDFVGFPTAFNEDVIASGADLLFDVPARNILDEDPIQDEFNVSNIIDGNAGLGTGNIAAGGAVGTFDPDPTPFSFDFHIDPNELSDAVNAGTPIIQFDIDNEPRGNAPDLGADECRPCEIQTGPKFRRGDHDGSGLSDITDALNLLGFLFLGTTSPICNNASDFDNSGALDITDALILLGHLFLGQPNAIPAPGTTECGLNPETIQPGIPPIPEQGVSDLGCDKYPGDDFPQAACP
jgi:hypothetical protein